MIETRAQAYFKAQKIQKRYVSIYKKYIYVTQIYYKLCEKYKLF